MPSALFDDRDIAALREALQPYTVEAVHEQIGPVGRTALGRSDFDGVARELTGDGPLETLIRLFVVGGEATEFAARAAFSPLPLEHAVAAGLLSVSVGSVRAEIDIQPYGQQGAATDWWVLSDFSSDVRPRPVADDHVLGINSSAVTLAQSTPRTPVGAALDICSGSGIQALHLSMHADAVVATDINERALRFAATSAAISGMQWDLRQGSFLEPVAAEEFDLVIANPPFVVSPGWSGLEYRDSGLPGDDVSALLAGGIPPLLAPGGVGQLLANWIIPADRPWEERVADWFDGLGCDAWVWQRDVADPGQYVSMWLSDAGEQSGTPRWSQRYDAWMNWLAAHEVAAIGMGLITVWRTDEDNAEIVVQDVRQAIEQPIGNTLPAWHARQRWLAHVSDADLLDARLQAADGLVRDRVDELDDGGWREQVNQLRQTRDMCWSVDVDDAISALVAGCDGERALGTVVQILAAALQTAPGEVAEAALPVVRDLVSRGFLVVPEPGP
jgi:hypothetical protein